MTLYIADQMRTRNKSGTKQINPEEAYIESYTLNNHTNLPITLTKQSVHFYANLPGTPSIPSNPQQRLG